MDALIASAEKDALVDLVKLSQKRGMKGSKGGWKEFLRFYDKKMGSSISDPSKRPVEDIVAFLKTFSQDEDLKIFEKVLQCRSNREAMFQFLKLCADSKSPEQKLVCLTLDHPQFVVDYSLPSHNEGWVIIKCSKKAKALKSTKMLAIDCEMALCEDGTEALIRVCVVDQNFQIKLYEYVKPSKAIADYRTDITGITASHLEGVTCSLKDVQESMKNLLYNGKILVGHGLSNDLRALQIDHVKVIDTSYVFKYRGAPSNKRPSLSNLCKFVLGYELRKNGSPHNCMDDAIAAMKLVKERIDNDCDDSIPFLPREEGEEKDRASMLFVHMIPVGIPSTDLHQIISGEFTVEMKVNRKLASKNKYYSAFAIFKNPQEANLAFEKLDGTLAKDISGRPQKAVDFRLGSGVHGSLCVCKMENPTENTAAKRPLQDEEPLENSKKAKTDHADGVKEMGKNNGTECGAHTSETGSDCGAHMAEIEQLKRELQQRDEEISNLNRIIVALVRKQHL